MKEKFIQIGERSNGRITKNEQYDIDEFMSLLYSNVNILEPHYTLKDRWDCFWQTDKERSIILDEHIVDYIQVIKQNIEEMIDNDN